MPPLLYQVDITCTEATNAIKRHKNSKVPMLDEVSAELLKHSQEVVVKSLTRLLNLIWQNQRGSCRLEAWSYCEAAENMQTQRL